MREIKFRADVCGELKEVSAVYYCENDKCWWVCDGNIDLWDDWLRASFVNQYTGIKDKNGKEIYEGDIIKLPEDGEEKIYYIKYSQNRLGFTLNNGCGFAMAYGIEVIGNIYENSELLEENHE